jgi:hypothetical protein
MPELYIGPYGCRNLIQHTSIDHRLLFSTCLEAHRSGTPSRWKVASLPAFSDRMLLAPREQERMIRMLFVRAVEMK